MIFEAIVNFFLGLVEGVINLLPDADAPEWMTDGTGYLQDIWSAGAGLGAWVPWSLVGMVFSAVLVAVGLSFTIKVVRIVASFFTAGGGSAA